MAKSLWIQDDPLNKYSEAVRSLRESLFSNVNGEKAPVIVFSSPHRGDGVTTLVANLGAAIANTGKKTLVINGDLGSPGLDEIFPAKKENGFMKLLSGSGGSPESTGVENLSYLSSGTAPIGPHPFDSPRVNDVMNKFRSEYGMILIDTAPILESSDPIVLGQKANGVILVFRSGHFIREDEITVRETLDRSKVKIIGAVVNRIREEDQDPYYTYQRYLEKQR